MKPLEFKKQFRFYWIFVVLIIWIALFFRTHSLTNVPPGLQYDEVCNACDALRIGPNYWPVFFTDNYGREPLMMYLLAGVLRIWGVGTWSVRFPAALAGTLTIVITYVLTARFYNQRSALFTISLMAVSFWPVMLSRVGLRAVLLPMVQGLAVYALLRTLEQSSIHWAIAAGFSSGLLPYTYSIPGQVFPLILLAWGWIFVIRSGKGWRERWKVMLITSVITVSVAFPFANFAIRYPQLAYQRVNVLWYETGQLLAGNVLPVLPSARAVLGMFTFLGDPSWRYNLAGRPVFNPLSGALFYLGLLITLVQMRGLADILWLVWLLTMLLPAMLTGSAPSFWRATGALVPIFAMFGVGTDFIWERTSRLVHRPWKLLALFCVGMLLLGEAIDTWRDYFQVWGHHSEVCDIYEIGVSAAARFLSKYEDQSTPVWISHRYGWDKARDIFRIQSNYPGTVRWFNGEFGIVWPSSVHNHDVLLIFTKSAPPPNEFIKMLEPYLVYTESAWCGTPYLWVYRLPQEVLGTPPWEAEHPIRGRFADGIEILGYKAPTKAARGEKVEFTLYWRVPLEHHYEIADPPWIDVCLEDAQNFCWTTVSHFPAYPPQDWTPGDLFAEKFVISVPDDAPPLPVHFRVTQHTKQREIRFVWPNVAGVPLKVGLLNIDGRAFRSIDQGKALSSFGELLLLKADPGSSTVAGGTFLRVVLQWQAMATPKDNYGILFWWPTDRAQSSEMMFVDPIWANVYPTSFWEAGETVRSYHQVPVPDLPDGEYAICLKLLGSDQHLLEGAPVCLGPVKVTSRHHSFETPSPQFTLNAQLGDKIQLLGYDLKATEPLRGGSIEVTLYWQALDYISESYTVFVHIYTPDYTAILAQHDGLPAGGTAPTNSWLPGEFVTDSHLIHVGPDAQEGVALVGVGMYLSETGERLPVSGDGADAENRRILLRTIRVGP